MSRRRLGYLVVLLAGLGVLPATVARARAGAAPRIQEMTFCLNESLRGQLLPPRCELLEFRDPPRWRSLISYRPDFNAELLETAEQM